MKRLAVITLVAMIAVWQLGRGFFSEADTLHPKLVYRTDVSRETSDSRGATLEAANLWIGVGTDRGSLVKVNASTGTIVSVRHVSATISAMATGPDGSVYLAGEVFGNFQLKHFPLVHAVQKRYGGGSTDAFVARLAPDGRWVYSTLLGGSSMDDAFDLAVDAHGRAYVVGGTVIEHGTRFPGFRPVSGFPGPRIYTMHDKGASVEVTPRWAFVAALDPAGHLLYSTGLGPRGVGDAEADTVALGPDGTVYLGGEADGRFPLVPATRPPTSHSNAFVSKLDSSGRRLLYSSFIATVASGEIGRRVFVSVDGAGDAYVATTTFSRALLRHAWQSTPPTDTCGQFHDLWCSEMLLAKLGPRGRLVFSTYFGDSGSTTEAAGVGIDRHGNMYVVGNTDGSLPTTNALHKHGGPGFVTVFDRNGTKLVYSTYLGGDTTVPRGILVDRQDSVYIYGRSGTLDKPTPVVVKLAPFP